MLPAFPWPYVIPIVLLICSNVFMTLAWYGHLNFKAKPLILEVLSRSPGTTPSASR